MPFDKDIFRLDRVPRKPVGQWITAALFIAFVAYLVNAFARGNIDWATVAGFLTDRTILHGLVNTILMTFIAMAVGLVLGAIFAVMRIVPNPVLNNIAQVYLWLFRGVPQLLQLYLWFNLALIFPTFGIPGLFEVQTINVMTPFVATILGLGLCQGAYTSEVMRAGILSVDKGQVEAGKALGMPGSHIMRRIVFPQSMRVVIPPVGNEFISMVKLTSLASAIQYSEMLHSAQNIYFVNGKVMELLFVATFWYLIVVTLFTFVQHFVEKKFSRGWA